MGRRKFSITELSCAIHESHPYSSDRIETKFATPKIIEALLGMAERGELPVSFTNGSDPEAGTVHTSLAGTPYKTKKGAARAAETRDDLQSMHYAIVSIDGGWGIQDVTAGYGDWFTYWADKDDRTDDEGNITAEGFYALGETMLVSKDDWSSFEKGSVFQDWIGDNAPPTEEQVEEFWPGSPKAKPGGPTREERSKGGRQPKIDTSLLKAIRRVIVDLTEDGILPSGPQVWDWLCEQGQEDNPYEFKPLIPGCDFMYVVGDTLHFQDQLGNPRERKRRSLDRYITEAKKILPQTE